MNLDHYNYWIAKLDDWCVKHSINCEQALSILFEDSPFNPDGPDKVTRNDLLACQGADEFYAHFLSQ